MITLEIEFVSGEGGFAQDPLTYKQIARNDRFAIYERSRDGKVKDFELIKIQVEKKGKQYKFPNGTVKTLEDDKEKYASSSQWGNYGWSFYNKTAAVNRMEEMMKNLVVA
jgi:hypothetical protein